MTTDPRPGGPSERPPSTAWGARAGATVHSNGHDSGASLGEELKRGRDEVMALRSEAMEIAGEFAELARREMDLARAEMQDNMDRARTGAMLGTVGAIIGILTLVFLGLAGMFALALVLPDWAAALIVAGVMLLIAAIALLAARSQFSRFSPIPRTAMQSIQEDQRWLREQLKRNTV